MADETTSKAIEGSSSPRPATAAEQRANAHAGTTDTDQLVSDIEKTREELAVTIDAIVDRVSPKKVVERSKQQAREGLNDATVIVKEHASTAAEVVREKAQIAGEVVKAKAAQVKERVSGPSDAEPVRSPLGPASSVAIGSAAPVASAPDTTAQPTTAKATTGPSPLPAGTVSVDVGELPPPEPADTTGSLADAADRSGSSVEPAGSELPAGRTGAAHAAAAPPVPPVYLGAALAAVASLLLLLRRRRARRAARLGRRR